MNPEASCIRHTLIAVAAAGVFLCTACAAPDSASPRAGASQPLADVVDDGPAAWIPDEQGSYRAAWASRLIGRQVIDNGNRHLGKIVDLVVDMRTGAAPHALVSELHGPGGERVVSVPVRALRPTERGGVFLEVDRERFAKLPSWRTSDADRERGTRVSTLIGRAVENREGQHLGRLLDVVIAVNQQQVRYTILGFDRAIGRATEHAFAVPIRSLAWAAAGGKLALDIAQPALAARIGSDPPLSPAHDGPRYLGTIDRTYAVRVPGGAATAGATR